MKIKYLCLSLAFSSLLLLSGCITTALAGSVYNSIGWLFGGTDTVDDDNKIDKIKENYNNFCKNADDEFDDFTDEILNSRTEDYVYSNLYSKNNYFGESGKLDFFALLAVYKNKLNNETENGTENIPLEISSDDINGFIPVYFNYSVNTYTTTRTITYEITNSDGETEQAEREITISNANVNFYKRYNLYDYINFNDAERDNADYIKNIISEILTT